MNSEDQPVVITNNIDISETKPFENINFDISKSEIDLPLYKSIDNNVNTVSPIPLPANNDINVDDCKHNESPPQVRSALTTDYLMDIDNSNNTDANGKNDNEITNLLTYEQFSCSISDLSFQEIIIENDALGLCVLFDKSDNIIDIIPKFISCDLFIYDREWADREMFWYLKYTDKNISEYCHYSRRKV